MHLKTSLNVYEKQLKWYVNMFGTLMTAWFHEIVHKILSNEFLCTIKTRSDFSIMSVEVFLVVSWCICLLMYVVCPVCYIFWCTTLSADVVCWCLLMSVFVYWSLIWCLLYLLMSVEVSHQSSSQLFCRLMCFHVFSQWPILSLLQIRHHF